MPNLTEEIFKRVLKANFTQPPPSFPVLVTDWGIIACPRDMQDMVVGKCRKDGQPDKRFRAAKAWKVRFQQETEKLKVRYVG